MKHFMQEARERQSTIMLAKLGRRSDLNEMQIMMVEALIATHLTLTKKEETASSSRYDAVISKVESSATTVDFSAMIDDWLKAKNVFSKLLKDVKPGPIINAVKAERQAEAKTAFAAAYGSELSALRRRLADEQSTPEPDVPVGESQQLEQDPGHSEEEPGRTE